MSDQPDNLILTLLRRIDGNVARLQEDMQDLKRRVMAMEEAVTGISRRLDRLEERVLRIERRLDLVDTP